jgi:pyruvate kinase
LFAP